MCRKNQVWGFSGVAFGLGLLIGCGMESGFWCCALGIGAIVVGFVTVCKRQA